MVRHRSDRISAQDFTDITEAIPNRLAYCDEMECDLYPIQESTLVSPTAGLTPTLSGSANPAADAISIHFSLAQNDHVTLELVDLLEKKSVPTRISSTPAVIIPSA